MADEVLYDQRGRIALITLNRPSKRNAFNDQQYDDLRGSLEDALADDAVKCAVVTGAPGAFSGGQDLSEMADRRVYDDGRPHGFAPFIDCLSTFDKPLIAAVNGAAYGGGCEIAAAADFVYASTNARFALTEVTLGIMPGAGGTQTLARAVGEAPSKKLVRRRSPCVSSRPAA